MEVIVDNTVFTNFALAKREDILKRRCLKIIFSLLRRCWQSFNKVRKKVFYHKETGIGSRYSELNPNRRNTASISLGIGWEKESQLV